MSSKRAFISYSHSDIALARQIADVLRECSVDVWIDDQKLNLGDMLATRIDAGIRETNYFVILISKSGVTSRWVEAELNLAFDLAVQQGLVIIPIRVDGTEMPLQLRGLLYLDASTNGSAVKERLRELLRADNTKVSAFSSQVRSVAKASTCEVRLRNMEIADLRFELSKRLSKTEMGVIWFDVFGTLMDNDINPVATCVVATEILFRAQARRVMDRLTRYICRERPDFCVE